MYYCNTYLTILALNTHACTIVFTLMCNNHSTKLTFLVFSVRALIVRELIPQKTAQQCWEIYLLIDLVYISLCLVNMLYIIFSYAVCPIKYYHTIPDFVDYGNKPNSGVLPSYLCHCTQIQIFHKLSIDLYMSHLLFLGISIF